MVKNQSLVRRVGDSSSDDSDCARGLSPVFIFYEYVVMGLGYVVPESKALPIPRKGGGIGLAGAVTLLP